MTELFGNRVLHCIDGSKLHLGQGPKNIETLILTTNCEWPCWSGSLGWFFARRIHRHFELRATIPGLVGVQAIYVETAWEYLP